MNYKLFFLVTIFLSGTYVSNIDAEIAIIGCLLWDNRNYEKIADFIDLSGGLETSGLKDISKIEILSRSSPTDISIKILFITHNLTNFGPFVKGFRLLI